MSSFRIDAKLFGVRLNAWYRRSRRRLPWRERPSLYKTVVSEFMLQQTQVDRVLPYFDRWQRAFPDFESLATASEEAVLKQWEGLGYYRRARSLHALARRLQALGCLPKTPQVWGQLPGVGPYSAAAITSIALSYPIAAVDGNVVRILARLSGEATVFKNSGAGMKFFTPLAAELLYHKSPGDHNQAMMELGATVCLKHRPLCTVCPVVAFCLAGRRGDADQYPRFASQKPERRTVERLWAIHERALLLHRRPRGVRRLAEIHELPEPDGLIRSLSPRQLLTIKRRGISNQRIEERIYRVAVTASFLKKVAERQDVQWVPFPQLEAITLSGPHRRWIQELMA